jgi:hypothetical protein
MTYEIIYTGGGTSPYRVNENGSLLKARFHTRREAEAWIAEKQQKAEQSYANRKGSLHAEAIPDVYGENLLNLPASTD